MSEYHIVNFPKNFFKMGNIILVLGNPGIGKTHAVVFLVHHALPYGFNALTNICMFRKQNIPEAKRRGWLNPKVKYIEIPDNFRFIPLASQLIIQACEGTNNIVVVDEAGITASSSKALGNTAVQMKFLGFSIRKIGACLVNIAQDETSVVPTLRSNIVKYKVNVLLDDKTNRRDLEFLVSQKKFDPVKRINIVDFGHYATIEDVPIVELPYDTVHPGGFIFDINLEKLYNRIAVLSYENNWDSIDLRKHMRTIVEEMVADKKMDDFLREKKFMSTSSVAELFGVTTQAVRDWIKDGKINAIKQGRNYIFSKKEVQQKAMNSGLLK